MIVLTLAGQFFRVEDAGPGLDHVWKGVEVKRVGGKWIPKAKARVILVRREGCQKVVEAPRSAGIMLEGAA